ncbi:serine/threonine protein kinase [Kangiella sp. HZ709]|uniref:serine/threonine protein kinase n=1 Tax=Kangiella sp. HZ709 TaxID=2666328 RepID=UPI0012B02223|nr:serine/threonine protein kinase [Kangiella sp. HZ709]MRX26621.1 serine/threonine protein kinase [Kangiella sp. HZ709]
MTNSGNRYYPSDELLSNDDSSSHPFEQLTPDFILDSIDALGYMTDGRILTLNSYENRVYQIGLEDRQPIIAKFYRPERWSPEQITEEHSFCFELAEAELPVVPPIAIDGQSLFKAGDFSLSVFERKGGHAPELDNLDNLFTLGRFLGRIHAVGKAKPFVYRPQLNTQTFGFEKAQFVSEKAIPFELKTAYSSLVNDVLKVVDRQWESLDKIEFIRTQGDCHPGNILWRDDNPHFIDFDDARMAPAIQDLWMLLSGDRTNRIKLLSEVVEGYQEFCDFDYSQIALIEPLRALRMIQHTAWIAERWSDPAFPQAFPQFASVNYWEQHVLDLRAQFSELQEIAENPLKLF